MDTINLQLKKDEEDLLRLQTLRHSGAIAIMRYQRTHDGDVREETAKHHALEDMCRTTPALSYATTELLEDKADNAPHEEAPAADEQRPHRRKTVLPPPRRKQSTFNVDGKPIHVDQIMAYYYGAGGEEEYRKRKTMAPGVQGFEGYEEGEDYEYQAPRYSVRPDHALSIPFTAPDDGRASYVEPPPPPRESEQDAPQEDARPPSTVDEPEAEFERRSSQERRAMSKYMAELGQKSRDADGMMKGWLYKKRLGVKGFLKRRIWTKRWFELHETTDGITPSVLHFHKSPTVRGIGSIVVDNSKIEVDASTHKKKGKAKYFFTINHPKCGKRELCAESEQERMNWINVLEVRGRKGGTARRSGTRTGARPSILTPPSLLTKARLPPPRSPLPFFPLPHDPTLTAHSTPRSRRRSTLPSRWSRA